MMIYCKFFFSILSPWLADNSTAPSIGLMQITQSSHLIIYAYICVQEGETLSFFYSITSVFSPCDLCNCSSDLNENCHSLEIWPVNQEVRTLAQKPGAGIFVVVKIQENSSLRSCFLSSLIIQRESLLYVARTKQTFINTAARRLIAYMASSSIISTEKFKRIKEER